MYCAFEQNKSVKNRVYRLEYQQEWRGNPFMVAEYTVLVVDDEEVIREGYSRVLRAEGFRILTASNGEEALRLMASEDVSVILCDFKMPVMGALEVLDETTVKYPDVPVIVITGYGTVDKIVECMRKGAHYFIGKPVRAEHLVEVTKKAIEERALKTHKQH